MKLRVLPKLGFRKTQFLIVNETGGLVEEFSGTEDEARRRASEIEAVRAGNEEAYRQGVKHVRRLALEKLRTGQAGLDLLIAATATGAERNAYCDANISLLTAIKALESA